MEFGVLTESIISAFRYVWWLLIPALALLLIQLPSVKGAIGEMLIGLHLRIGLPKQHYHTINNITVETNDGTTQIDHVIVSPYGVFVIETKNMKGWIFGRERERQWTQKLYQRSFQFQNPLYQNHRHVKALESILELPAHKLHSVVVFTGSCVLKSKLPGNVTRGVRCVPYIKSFTSIVMTADEVNSALTTLSATRLPNSRKTHNAHAHQLKVRHSKPSCPQCGEPMVKRVARRGANTGQPFWGCSSFPACKATRKAA